MRDWPAPNTSAEYVAALDKAAADARSALRETTEEHLQTRWQLLAGGEVVSDTPRHEMLRDTINHWAHHRGQMTVYLRLMGAKVPALMVRRLTIRALPDGGPTRVSVHRPGDVPRSGRFSKATLKPNRT